MTSSQNQRSTGTHKKARSDALVIGTVLKNRYRTVSYLGRGGMSNVYKALDSRTGATVAVKILHSELLSDETRVKRFFQEAKTYRNLRHKHIIKLYDFFTDEADRHCIVMEYMEGKNLSETLDERGKLTVRRAIKIFTEICDALGYAHKQGIVHRDLKPSNIALVEKGGDADYVKILDFGIAKLIPSDTDTLTDLGLTQTGEIVGSPLYMSPEQCMAKTIDLRSDIYSLGCLMYEALTGQPPLIGGNVYETFHMQTHERPKPLAELRPEFKDGTQLESIILKCMAKNPKHRFQSMQQVIDALEQVGSYTPRGSVANAIHAWQEKQIRKHAERGKGVNPVLVAVLTALIIGGGTFTFKDKIIRFIEPAERRYHHAVKIYDNAVAGLDFNKAETASVEALNIADEERKEWVSPSLVRVIDLYRMTGRYKAADQLSDRLRALEEADKKDVFKGEQKGLASLRNLITSTDGDKDQIEDYCYQLNDIAVSYMDAGMWDRARTLLEKTIVLAKEGLPENSLVINNLVDNLAILDLKDNHNEKYLDVKKKLEEAIELRKNAAGRASAGLFPTLEALADVNRRLGELDQAKENALEALGIARNTYRPTSPQAAEAKCELAEIYLAQNQVPKALSTLNAAAASLERSSEVPETLRARTFILLADALRMSDEADKAIKRYEEALNILAEVKEPTEQELLLRADANRGLGDMYSTRIRKNDTKAEACYLNALVAMLRSPAREENKVLNLVGDLARMYRSQQKTEKIRELYEMVEHVDKMSGKTNGVIEDMLLLAEYHRENQDLKMSTKYLEDALSLAQSFYGFEGAKTAQISSALAHTYMLTNDYKQAKSLAEKPVELIRSDNLVGSLDRAAKLKIFSTYARYLDHSGDKEKMAEIQKEIDEL
ncbi:MAG: serine/threonine protein kinase [Candidatus Obscuribacterales bacterium]|nr:serine/threonine protein kinase [Candidatus Obscuribacterales bacterium]